MPAPIAKPTEKATQRELVAILAVIGGAMAMGASPVFVRLSEVGPYTSAFYRVFLALPVLWFWARLEDRGTDARPDPRWSQAILLAGAFFAGDLFFWHLAIVKTTMANATLMATMAPIWVALFSGLFIGEPVSRATFFALGLCCLGAALLTGSSLNLGGGRLIGDLYGLATSLFFGLYFLAVRVARRNAASGVVLFRSTIVTSIILGVIAAILENAWLPATLSGAVALVTLAWFSHAGGQGLLAFALGHLSASFSSLVIFLEAVFAALFGWLLFSEALEPLQIGGGAAILLGIWIARPR